MVDYAKENYYLIDATNADYHSIFQNNSFDVCINCSGAASVPDSLIHPLRDFTLNTYNVFKLMDAIRLFQPFCKFINLSSAAVYGNPQQLPVVEDLVLNPISPYGMHKMQAEMIGRGFYQHYNIANCSLRIFSAYGAGLKKQILWDVYHKARKSDKIELFGTGQESRDFIYVDDVVAAINHCIHKAKFQGEAINIANGHEVTISQVVTTFLSSYFPGKLVYFNGKAKQGDPLYWKADITTLKAMGYTPGVDLNKGLQKYYTWISQL
jgi:dTDP-glucose 4,6-dehydratase/UDP-glucose 4-epimerase